MASAALSTTVLDDFSLEMTGKDVAGLDEAHAPIPAGTRINVTFLGDEDLRMRLDAARVVRRLGFVPVPHISARRLASADALGQFLDGLHADGTCDDVFVVGGDPAESQGPYPDALSIIRSGLLQTHGVRHVGISGYPEGHPAIPEHELWGSLADKYSELEAQGLSGSIITQFGFDSDAVLAWVQRVRECGIDLPVRVGVPGPVGVAPAPEPRAAMRTLASLIVQGADRSGAVGSSLLSPRCWVGTTPTSPRSISILTIRAVARSFSARSSAWTTSRPRCRTSRATWTSRSSGRTG
jgi:methylenetetrahydrofolate reductase (NADPH)